MAQCIYKEYVFDYIFMTNELKYQPLGTFGCLSREKCKVALFVGCFRIAVYRISFPILLSNIKRRRRLKRIICINHHAPHFYAVANTESDR